MPHEAAVGRSSYAQGVEPEVLGVRPDQVQATPGQRPNLEECAGGGVSVSNELALICVRGLQEA